MVSITINNRQIFASEEDTILEAAKKNGINIPHLCFLKGINEIGACRVCAVEVEGKDKLVSACNNKVREGMNISVNSPKAREARRMNLELILSQHNCNCPTCVRSGNCVLQTISNDLGIIESSFAKKVTVGDWDENFPLIRDESKCIKCMRCIQICDKVQTLSVWDIANTGSRTTVSVKGHKSLKEANCSYCGQCVTHCPVGALYERNDIETFYRHIEKKDKIVIAQVAPAVRVAWGEYFGLDSNQANENKLVTALKQIGFDYVFDTNFAADLTIMEEAHEFLERFAKKDSSGMPMFTSCCPAWVSFVKSQYPQWEKYLSTAKSPQQMFGAIIKTYYAQILDVDPSEIYQVSIMPCMAKKDEIRREGMSSTQAGYDIDLVLTTRELVRMLRERHVDIEILEEQAFDNPLGTYSGAGAIFGSTGGVMEAALRTAYYLVTGKNPPETAFQDVRGSQGIRIKTFDMEGTQVKVGIATGLGNARQLIQSIDNKEVELDFVEVMACPGGCVGGGGQPFVEGKELAEDRAKDIYTIDKHCQYRYSHENPRIQALYTNFLGKSLGEKAEHLLHIRQ